MCVLLTFSSLSEAQTLVWEENFDGTAINPSFWSFEVGDGCNRNLCGWGNNELQYYTDRSENARIENGNLVIEARKEAYQTRQFTSARLKTEAKLQFKYGTVEARIKIPNLSNGLWPALWTLGSVGGVWPANGEIDILEMGIREAVQAGLTNRRVGAAVHWEHNNTRADYGIHFDNPTDLTDDYHTYKMVWNSQAIGIYIDNREYFTFNIAGAAGSDLEEFHNPHFLLLNLAVGGNYTGITTVNGITAPFPAKMYVDYIRLYQNPGDVLYKAEDHVIAAGNFGVYTETVPTIARLNYDGGANLFVWNGLAAQTATPFEGTEVLSYQATPANWFGFGTDHPGKNLSAYRTSGSLKFHMKTSSTATFKVGVKNGTTESWINFENGQQQYGLVRDGNWHEVTIPLSSFSNPAVDFTNVTSTFMLSADAPAANVDFQVDNIYYTTGSVFKSAPYVSITAPAVNAPFQGPANITLQANATDPDGTITKVEFYNGTTLLGTATTSPYTFNWNNVPVGTYAITAKAYDNENLTTTSSVREVVVNAVSASSNFGVYTETTVVGEKLNYPTDASLYLWEGTLSAITNPAPSPFEGTDVIAVKETGGKGWYGFGIALPADRNLSTYAINGQLKFHMKTTATGTFKVGIKGGAVESWINIPETGNQYGLIRDGQWHQVTIPFSQFRTVAGFDLSKVNQAFMFASVTTPPAGAEFFIDNIYYSPGPLGVKEDPELKASVTLYPNPTNRELQFASVKSLKGSTILITDVTGREVLKTQLKGNQLDVQHLPAGLYTLTLQHNGKITHKRFVKN